jgi:hypothetical protein
MMARTPQGRSPPFATNTAAVSAAASYRRTLATSTHARPFQRLAVTHGVSFSAFRSGRTLPLVRVGSRTLRSLLHHHNQTGPGCPLAFPPPPFQLISDAFDEVQQPGKPSTHSSQRACADWLCAATTPRSGHFAAFGARCTASVAVWGSIRERTPRSPLRRQCAPSSARDTISFGCIGCHASSLPRSFIQLVR